ncbi:cytochrome P450 4F2-like [Saccoglossus kowalevskii]|uniref:Leukotriene-B(4) omega-hydroxylase 1-like n=1 Tax=Saccoglossus kowalevskii TaxID=10224 RepID=A0ABM0GKM8_SACKO|nr:PREDICTED: leukotriene-B(4) omega-hydroxylase 1-like [Saccoglossus kowalevskii]
MLGFLRPVLQELVSKGYDLFNYRFLGLFILVALFSNVLCKLYQQLRTRWRAERDLIEIPSPHRHWLFGHLHLFKNNEDSLAEVPRRALEFSPAAVIWLGPFVPRVMVNHPTTIKAILTTSEPKDEFLYGLLKPWLGDGLLISSRQKWFRNRRLLTPGFHFDILRPYVQIYNDCVKTMLDKWSNLCASSSSKSVSVEMFGDLSLMTLDSLLKCIFSQESHCQTAKSQNPYISSVYALSHLISERGRFVPYHSDIIYNLSISGYKFRKALRAVHGYSVRVIQERKQALQQSGDDKPARKYIDFLDILLRAKDEDGNGLSDREIRDEVDTFMFEGHDTTASGLSWCLYNFAKYPEHQRRCQEEIDALLVKTKKEDIEWGDLSHLPYTTLCIKESLRIRSPVPMISRELKSPLTLPDGRFIPAGYNVLISINGVHNNSLVWDNPTEFDPSRFLPENTRYRSPYAYVPFSAGPRNCIGQNFAMNEMKVVVARTLRRFDLSPELSRQPQRISNLVLRSSNGIYVHVKPRN